MESMREAQCKEMSQHRVGTQRGEVLQLLGKQESYAVSPMQNERSLQTHL